MPSGLSISREYFDRVRPLLERDLADLVSLMAIGVVGEGSDCFGYDDAFSRDHDWGPGFCLWLPRETAITVKDRVQAVLARLPVEHGGYPVMMAGERRGLQSIEGFYSRFLGRATLPETWQDWRLIPEHFLAVSANGEVFMDNLGEFSRWREALLAFYPEDVRLKKIACRLAGMAQAGQYNMGRSMHRKASVPAMLSAARFTEQTSSLVYLLNKRYAPFYKWMHRGLLSLPLLGEEAHAHLGALVGVDFSQGPSFACKATSLVEDLCMVIVQELRNLGLSDASGAWLLDHAASVQSRINTPELRSMSVMSE